MMDHKLWELSWWGKKGKMYPRFNGTPFSRSGSRLTESLTCNMAPPPRLEVEPTKPIKEIKNPQTRLKTGTNRSCYFEIYCLEDLKNKVFVGFTFSEKSRATIPICYLNTWTKAFLVDSQRTSYDQKEIFKKYINPKYNNFESCWYGIEARIGVFSDRFFRRCTK